MSEVETYINSAPQGIILTASTLGCASAKQTSLLCTRLALKFHETEDYTIYPAPILSVTRLASEIGVGIFQNAYGHGANLITAG